MTKITLSVSKVYKNSGRFRFHRKKTKKAWKHCFMSDDYTDELTFGTEWVDSVTAQFLKLKRLYKRNFYCFECRSYWSDYVKKRTQMIDCPYCDDE